jgi:5-methylcytosine-specific restriction enzyme subunit McrC
VPNLHLHEWTTATPESHSALADLTLPHDLAMATTLKQLQQHRMLEVRELRSGLELRTFSWVGRFQLGPLTVSVHPKLDRIRLLDLLRYAYGLRDIELLSAPVHAVGNQGFVELLVLQLLREAEEIVARGLHRLYELQEDWVAGLRGRIDFTRLAALGGIRRASLPCRHHPGTEDSLLNQVLCAGLRLAARLSLDPWLSGRAWRLSQAVEPVTDIRLGHDVFAAVERRMTRLTSAYAPALRLIHILWKGYAAVLDEPDDSKVRLEGFLFDMNRFFQALLGRFLTENLRRYTVVEEEALAPVYEYSAGMNPRNRRPPRPRPDFIVRDGATTVALLDAKYRDLWESRLPREMLYQLSVYALGQPDVDTAVILYPTMSGGASDQCIEIRDPMNGRPRAAVVMRPVRLDYLAELISPDAPAGAAASRETLAKEWVFGQQ